MTAVEYSVRVSPWSPERTYRAEPQFLLWKGARREGRLDYSGIREVRICKVRYFGSRATYWRCTFHYGFGRRIRLQAAHFSGLRRIEDRTAAYIPFIKKLEAWVAAANPEVVFREGRPWIAVIDAAAGRLFVLLQRSTRIVGLAAAAPVAQALMRVIGPRLKGHRVARQNLIAAFPEKSAAEIERILGEMWDNIAAIFVEYAHLDRIWKEPGAITLDAESRRLFLERDAVPGPVLMFSAHLANWELLPWALGSRKGEAAVVYRPPKIGSVERELARLRAASKATYIPANADAILRMKDVLRRGGFVGLLMDEHFSNGSDVSFFARPSRTTPIFARLARQFDCPIYGARMVRLSCGRFRLDITGPVEAPRDAAGKIDVAATTRLITEVIEGWVRDNPGQWLWLQRRWR